MKRNRKKILVWLLFICSAGLVVSGYIFYEYNRKAPATKDLNAAYAVTAPELVVAFEKNENNANQLYLGKVLQVQGPLRSVEQEPSGNRVLILGDSLSMSSVRCFLPADASAVKTIFSPGTTISVKGICTGFQAGEMGLGSDVILNRCIIQ